MIDILMATYNGEKYLAEQIESIINQSYTNWHLYIQDDCSTDRTLTVAFSYQKKFPEKITVIKNTKNSGSAKDNFFSMLSLSTSEYIMFSDQDDIWLPDKIKITHNRMLRLEKKYGKKYPVLVHTDLTLVDSDLNWLSESMYRHEKWNIHRKITFWNSLIGNIVTGCTVEINRALLKNIRYNNVKKIPMHDWWMGLCARYFGIESVIDRPTILYRQHTQNSVGVETKSKIVQLIKVFTDKKAFIIEKNRMKSITDACEEFYTEYTMILERKDKIKLEGFIKRSYKSKVALMLYIIKNKISGPYGRLVLQYLFLR